MVTVIKKGAGKKSLSSSLKKAASKKSAKKEFDAYKYCGVVKFKEDGLELQKKWRDEWK